MKCINCGNELEEGKLYCSKCGYEIQMVPDFEPEVENEIIDALGEITNELQQDEEAFLEEDYEAQLEKAENVQSKIRFFSAVISVAVIVLFGLTVFIYNKVVNTEYLLEKAETAAIEQKYEKAIEYALRAVEADGSDMEIRNLLATYYIQAGQLQNAETVFLDLISLDNENESAYRGLISLYEKDGKYQEISDLIRLSSSSEIQTTFSKYLANEPSFSHEQGTYTEIVHLKLTSNTSGTVYYTTDGSEPTENSPVYQNPILLEDGVHTIRAFFVNSYGLKSNIAVQIIQVNLPKAHEPEINLDSGSYSTPQMLEVTVPGNERIYYSIDGSTPTMDSIPYNNPIALPIGSSSYQFISYNENGVASEVVKRDYTFLFQSTIDMTSAVNLLVLKLTQEGILADIDGTVTGKNGINLYICSSAISINRRNYYLVVEYYRDLTGIDTRTGNMYCVDAENGGVFKASIGEDGYYSVVSF